MIRLVRHQMETNETSSSLNHIFNLRAKKKENEDLIALWEQKCEERRQKYAKETAERDAELDVIGQVEDIVNDRILSMDGYLSERVNV